MKGMPHSLGLEPSPIFEFMSFLILRLSSYLQTSSLALSLLIPPLIRPLFIFLALFFTLRLNFRALNPSRMISPGTRAIIPKGILLILELPGYLLFNFLLDVVTNIIMTVSTTSMIADVYTAAIANFAKDL